MLGRYTSLFLFIFLLIVYLFIYLYNSTISMSLRDLCKIKIHSDEGAGTASERLKIMLNRYVGRSTSLRMRRRLVAS